MKHFVLGREYTTHHHCLVFKMFTVALDGIWSIKRNLPVGGMIPGQQSRNSSLPQAKYYSRHGGLRSKTPVPLTPAGALGDCSACEQVAHHEDPQPKPASLPRFCQVTFYLPTLSTWDSCSSAEKHTSTDSREVHI